MNIFFFRGLLRDKQEELDATQCQAHWIVLQQESIIAETSKELIVISDLVNDWLSKFGNQNEPEEVGLLLFFPPTYSSGLPHCAGVQGTNRIFPFIRIMSLYPYYNPEVSGRRRRVSIQAEDFFHFRKTREKIEVKYQ